MRERGKSGCFSKVWLSTGLGLGTCSQGGPQPAEDSSPLLCSAGGTSLRSWVCCLALLDHLLLVGSSFLSPGMHPLARAAGRTLLQLCHRFTISFSPFFFFYCNSSLFTLHLQPGLAHLNKTNNVFHQIKHFCSSNEYSEYKTHLSPQSA